jgi:hypothetical protein
MSINSNYRRFNRIVAALFYSLIMSTHPVYAEQPKTEIEAPENWYQVEVILFTQQGNIGNEAPPQDYQLEFPSDWVELIDPNMPTPENTFPLAEGGLVNLSQPVPLERRIPLLVVTDPVLGESPQNPDRKREIDDIDSYPADDAYVAQYEAQFLMLDKLDRDLNDSATALDRRQYNVVFHQAWRFDTDDNSEDPWILIKAGQQFEDRFQLEGALRFYRSRFLHFETDLWLLGFPNLDDGKPQLTISLPAVPFKEAAAVDEMILSGDYNDRANGGVVTEDSADVMPDVALSTELASLDTEVNAIEMVAAPAAVKPKTYPISSVWVLNKSKRIEEETVYYIDHPMMGVMVTIKGYEPPLLNPPQAIAALNTPINRSLTPDALD